MEFCDLYNRKSMIKQTNERIKDRWVCAHPLCFSSWCPTTDMLSFWTQDSTFTSSCSFNFVWKLLSLARHSLPFARCRVPSFSLFFCSAGVRAYREGKLVRHISFVFLRDINMHLVAENMTWKVIIIRNLSDDRSKASSKTIPPLNAI
jgi:hypothetical protein